MFSCYSDFLSLVWSDISFWSLGGSSLLVHIKLVSLKVPSFKQLSKVLDVMQKFVIWKFDNFSMVIMLQKNGLLCFSYEQYMSVLYMVMFCFVCFMGLFPIKLSSFHSILLWDLFLGRTYDEGWRSSILGFLFYLWNLMAAILPVLFGLVVDL